MGVVGRQPPVLFTINTLMEWKKILSYVAAIGTVVTMVAGLFALDDRYPKNNDLQAMENRIVSQMNEEVAKNRDIMIQNLEREEFDLRFLVNGYDDPRDVPPLMLQKLESVQKLLTELESDD